jgi:DNA-binding MarR family transcriptional regulator
VLLSKSGLSRLFIRLERRGLVERRGNPQVLRVTYAILTEEGREALEGALPTFPQEVEARSAGHLDKEELLATRQAMRKVIRATGDEPLSEGAND